MSLSRFKLRESYFKGSYTFLARDRRIAGEMNTSVEASARLCGMDHIAVRAGGGALNALSRF